MRPDGDDFVVATHTDGLVIFRNKDADALRKLCRSLRWEIIRDATEPADKSTSSLVPSDPDAGAPDEAVPNTGWSEVS